MRERKEQTELQLAIEALSAIIETTTPRGLVREFLANTQADLLALLVVHYDA